MTSQPESLDPKEVQTHADKAVTDNRVVLFMKDNRLMPQCGCSAKAVSPISQYVDEFETVDVLPALPHYRGALKEKGDWETIPRTFVGGEFVSGNDILEELDERGDLEATLTGAN